MKLSSILAAAVCLPAMLLSSCGSSSSPMNEFYAHVDLIPVTTTKDGKWSMVNAKGEIVYDSEFKNQPSTAYNGLFSVREGDGYTVYKIGGKSPEIVGDLEGLKSVGALEDGLMPVTFPGRRISVVDASGKLKFELGPVKGSEITSCESHYSEGMLRIKTEDGNYGYVNKSGEVVIQPIYSVAYPFSEGLAVVGKRNDDTGETSYSVIDKSGNERFKIKEGYSIEQPIFIYGHIVTRKDDRLYMVNTKGEEIKLSAKVNSVYLYNDKYIIFYSEDWEKGVINFKDEIIVRPKYREIDFGNGDFFIARKNSDDKEFIKINYNGEESGEPIDYEELRPYGKFGYLAKEGKTYVLLNDNFEKKGSEEFFDVNFNISLGYGGVTTDYFNPSSAAEAMVHMINGNRVAYLELGYQAEDVLKHGRSPRDCADQNYCDFSDLTEEGFRYKITVRGGFTENITTCTNNGFFSWNKTYDWNPNSFLSGIYLFVSTEAEWGEKGQDAFKAALTGDGYEMIKDGMSRMYTKAYASVFKKGDIVIYAESTVDGQSGYMIICTVEYEQLFLSYVDSGDGSAADTATTETAAADTTDYGCEVYETDYD